MRINMTAVIKCWIFSKGSATSNKITGILWLNARQDKSMYEVTTSSSIRQASLDPLQKITNGRLANNNGAQRNYNR